MPVMIGVDALVPPTSTAPGTWKVSYTSTPVFGSASAAASFCVLVWQPLVKWTSTRCQDGLASKTEQPEAVPFLGLLALVPQTDSVHPRPLLACRSAVPPTDVTNCRSAGKLGPKPRSPDAKLITWPGWLKKWLKRCCWLNSKLPQLLETYFAPLAIAVFSAMPRFSSDGVDASTSVMWHLGQIAETMSRSSDSSSAQPASALGSGLLLPCSLS